MAFDPTISLNVRPPQLTPMADLIYAGARAKQAQQEIGLQQQQRDLNIERIAQEKALSQKTAFQAAAEAKQQASQEAYIKSVSEARDADGNVDTAKMRKLGMAADMTPEHREMLMNHIAQEDVRLAQATKEQKAIEQKDKEDFGVGLRAIRQAPPEQQLPAWQSLLQEASTRVNPITKKPYVQPGQLDSNTVPPTAMLGIMERMYRGQPAYDAADKREEDLKKTKQKEMFDLIDRMHKEAAPAFEGLTTQDGVDRAIGAFAHQDEDHATYAKNFLTNLPTNTPEAIKSSLKTINRRAMTAEQKTKADEVENKGVADPKTLVELEIAAANPTISEAKKQQYGRAIALHKENRVTPNNSGVQDRFDQREADKLRVEADKDRDKVHELQDKEQDKWKQVAAYESASRSKNGDPVVDPSHTTNQSLKMTDELRAQYLATAAAARKEAATHNQAQDQILAQHQWGDYAPGKSKASAAASPAGGAVTAPPASAAPVAKPAVAPKVATMDQVRAYAKKFGMTEDAAKTAVQSQGFKIR